MYDMGSTSVTLIFNQGLRNGPEVITPVRQVHSLLERKKKRARVPRRRESSTSNFFATIAALCFNMRPQAKNITNV